MSEDLRQEKRERILDAALSKFSAYGFARTSMNDIAEAADMSRPALYQYYGNKEEVFQAMLGRLLNNAADRAIDALTAQSALNEQLDGFLQRWFGDLTEQLRSTEHGADIIEAKNSHAKPAADQANARISKAVSAHLKQANPEKAKAMGELVLLAPLGLKYDQPTMTALRSRLTTLANSIAESMQSE